MLLGVALTTAIPLADSVVIKGAVGAAPAFAAEDTSTGMSSVSDSKLRLGAASTGDKGRQVCAISGPVVSESMHVGDGAAWILYERVLLA